MSPVRETVASALLTVAIYGGFAVGYAAVSIARKFWLIPVWALVQSAAFTLLANFFHAGVIENRKELEHQMIRSSECVARFWPSLPGTLSSSSSFAAKEPDIFEDPNGNRTGPARYTRSLVPKVERNFDGFEEIFGASVPSGDVGGDLVDVVESAGEWIAYIADISGHGVAAGVLMAMFKTSIRSGFGR